MRFKELKCKGSSSTENTKKAIRENCSISEIVSFYKFLYYIPTEKGNNVIKNNEDFIKNRYAGWRLSSGYAKYRYVNPDCIEFYRKNIINQELHIDKKNSKFQLHNNGKIKNDIRSWVMPTFPPPENMLRP